MLVNTIYKAAADLWHWIILFILVNFGFVLLGMAQFGSDLDEFSSFQSTFELLWEMLLGAMLGCGSSICLLLLIRLGRMFCWLLGGSGVDVFFLRCLRLRDTSGEFCRLVRFRLGLGCLAASRAIHMFVI